MSQSPAGQIREDLAGIKGIAFDAFGTTCSGSSVASFLPWHRSLPAGERRAIRAAWMRGELGPADLVALGEVDAAPPADALERALRAGFDKVQPYPDVPAVLEDLQRRGYRMVTISNLVAPFRAVLEQRLRPWMAGFVLSYEQGALKPDQRLFQAAAEILSLPPRQILMVGDSVRADVRGAESLGMPSVLVDRRGGNPDAITSLAPLLDQLPGPVANRQAKE